jgi:hypothetical protein
MDQAASDYVLAVRVLHTGSIIMTHAVGHARAVAASYPALRSSCMSSPLSPSFVPPPGQIRGEGVCDVTLQTVKQGRPGCPGGRVLRVFRSDHFPIIPPLPQPQPPASQQQNRKRKSKTSKGDRNMQRGRSVYQVLCVNTEPCANAGGEVRGDLHHGVPVASTLSPQAYEGLPEVVVEVVGSGGVGD